MKEIGKVQKIVFKDLKKKVKNVDADKVDVEKLKKSIKQKSKGGDEVKK